MTKKISSSLNMVESVELSKTVAREIENNDDEDKSLAELLNERQNNINNSESV